MANFDLISEDDFFSGEKKEKPDQKPPETPQPDEDLFALPLPEEEVFKDQDLADDLNVDIAEQEESPAAAQDFSEDVKDNFDFSQPEAEPQPEPEPEVEPQEQQDRPEPLPDYYDDKQKQINYKPFIIGISAVLAIIIIFFIGKTYLFNGSSSDTLTGEQKADQAAEETQGPSAEEIRKTNFYTELTGKTKFATSRITGISGVALKQAKLSSVLFYGSDFTFEVFAKTRDELAKLNIQLKNNFKNADIKIISSQKRPGSSGGVLGVYKLSLAGNDGSGTGGSVAKPLKSAEEAKSWLTFLAENGSLKKSNLKTRSLGRKEGFDVQEIDVNLSGSRDNLLQFVESVGGSGKNIKISKLSMSAVDKRTFNSKKYRLRLILQIYV